MRGRTLVPPPPAGEKSRTYLDEVCADELGVKPDTVLEQTGPDVAA